MGTTRVMAAVLAAGLGVTACSVGADPAPSGPDLDPRSYYEDYDAQIDRDSAAGGAHAPVAVDASSGDSAEAGPDVLPPEPGFLDDNVFVDVGDPGWVQTASDRESTFALDVDTGSFSVARTFVDNGHRPEPDSIRIEEWVNSFDYGDPAPTDGALGLTVESAASPRGGEGTTTVRVGVSTEQLSAEDRPAANVTFVIDTSGSMNIRERLGLVQSSLALLATNLRPDDTIAIVVYGSDAEPLLVPTPVSELASIVEAIEALEPGGSTNMEAGLLLGYEQARESYDPEAVNVVVLASDGVANVGVTDPAVLTDQITRASDEGIHLVTVGYGMGNYNDRLMEQLANQGNGFYSYVDTFEEAERLFVDELTPTLHVVAYDTKAQVVFDEEQVERYRLIGYENRRLDDSDFTDDAVDAGELGAGHQVSALYEVQPVNDAAPGQQLGTVSLRWADRAGGEATQLDAAISWPGAEASSSLRLAALVSDTAELLKGTSTAADRGFTLADLQAEAEHLAQLEVNGAAEALAFLESAQAAGPTGPPGDED
ncbi:vWA domain-containing protein [Ornithinimicrobium pratense]|uniref:DUF3520 domain-containing protein n=1 Tax=Ornithinimicrobium pratense TaxID=2593973 RepID=A0A5J6V1E1_9MICO|nr:von Willebrand factor type A domain-containing protein [Ornithinimicrobium pratense]QFG67590.1 DUF3520 domain-containing protein [Ornithinimicrobium pratense]